VARAVIDQRLANCTVSNALRSWNIKMSEQKPHNPVMMTRFSTAKSNTLRFVPSAQVVLCVNRGTVNIDLSTNGSDDRFLMLPNEQIYIYGCQRLIGHLTFKNADDLQDKQRLDFLVSR